jgi:hypothetical protein
MPKARVRILQAAEEVTGDIPEAEEGQTAAKVLTVNLKMVPSAVMIPGMVAAEG